MVAMADNNGKENKTKAGYSAHKSRRRSFTVDALHRFSDLSAVTVLGYTTMARIFREVFYMMLDALRQIRDFGILLIRAKLLHDPIAEATLVHLEYNLLILAF